MDQTFNQEELIVKIKKRFFLKSPISTKLSATFLSEGIYMYFPQLGMKNVRLLSLMQLWLPRLINVESI